MKTTPSAPCCDLDEIYHLYRALGASDVHLTFTCQTGKDHTGSGGWLASVICTAGVADEQRHAASPNQAFAAIAAALRARVDQRIREAEARLLELKGKRDEAIGGGKSDTTKERT